MKQGYSFHHSLEDLNFSNAQHCCFFSHFFPNCFLDYEVARQIEVREQGLRVNQETRGFDAKKNVTYRMRTKEDEVDYRYLFALPYSFPSFLRTVDTLA
jgi:hypothetical protein